MIQGNFHSSSAYISGCRTYVLARSHPFKPINSSATMKKTILVSMIVLFFLSGFAHAQGLRHILPELMNHHELIKAAEANRDAALSAREQARGGWYPSVDLLSEAGQE